MKVGVFTETYRPQVNGVVTSIVNLNRFLKREGHTAVVFTTGEEEEVEDENGTALHRFKSFPFNPYPEYLIGLPHVRKAVGFAETYELDLLHSHGAFSMGACALYAKKSLGLPLVGTFHTMLPDYMHYIVGSRKRAKEVLKRPSWGFLKWYFNQCDAVVAPTESTARELEAHDFENVEVVPSGVDVERFRPVKSGFAESEGIGKSYVLFLGRITLEKNVETVLEVAKLMPETQFVVAGKGPRLEGMKEKAGKNVFFAGFVPDDKMAELYSGASAFVMPSRTDTQGLTILEAMACGTPVICRPERGPKELVKEGKNGFFAESPEEFAERVGDVGKEMRKKARKTAEEYSVERCGRMMVKLYRRLSK